MRFAVVMLLAGLVGSQGWAEETAGKPSPGGCLAMGADASVPKELAARVSKFVAESFDVSVCPVPPATVAATDTPEAVATNVSKVLKTGQVLAVYLIGQGACAPRQPVTLDGNVAIVATQVLKQENKDDAQAGERFERRVEKEAVRALGQLIGLNPCPNPMCALHPHQTWAQLDGKGRNLCPPCRRVAHRDLAARNMTLTVPAPAEPAK